MKKGKERAGEVCYCYYCHLVVAPFDPDKRRDLKGSFHSRCKKEAEFLNRHIKMSNIQPRPIFIS